MTIELLQLKRIGDFIKFHKNIMKKTYQQEQYNELHPRPKSRYEQESRVVK